MASFRYYIRHAKLTVEEGEQHEFKGHRTVCSEDMHPRNAIYVQGELKQTRQPLSKYFCGMLNTGKGGTFHLGVLDDGSIEGFMMTRNQQNHLRLAIHDVLGRFRPPVPSHMYKVRFVPVLEKQGEKLPELPYKSDTDESMEHALRTINQCWCDFECMAYMGLGLLPATYVVEVVVLPWDPSLPQNRPFIQVHFIDPFCI